MRKIHGIFQFCQYPLSVLVIPVCKDIWNIFRVTEYEAFFRPGKRHQRFLFGQGFFKCFTYKEFISFLVRVQLCGNYTWTNLWISIPCTLEIELIIDWFRFKLVQQNLFRIMRCDLLSADTAWHPFHNPLRNVHVEL